MERSFRAYFELEKSADPNRSTLEDSLPDRKQLLQNTPSGENTASELQAKDIECQKSATETSISTRIQRGTGGQKKAFHDC